MEHSILNSDEQISEYVKKFGYTGTNGKSNSELQSNMNCGTFDVNKFNINSDYAGTYGKSVIEKLINDNVLFVVDQQKKNLEIVKINRELRFELEESQERIKQLENDIKNLWTIEEENTYLRELLKMYL